MAGGPATAAGLFYGVRVGNGVNVIGSDGRGRVGAAVVGAGVGAAVVGSIVGVGVGVGAAVRGTGVTAIVGDALADADGDGLAEGAASC
jgi:hypothetical protein